MEQRYRLLPYLKTLYHEWGARGRPLVRPLHLHYPDTRALGLWRQFLLGQASQFLHKTLFHPFFAFCHFDHIVGPVMSEIFLSFLDVSILRIYHFNKNSLLLFQDTKILHFIVNYLTLNPALTLVGCLTIFFVNSI